MADLSITLSEDLMKNTYDVIIVGGGPTGVALGIELGLHGIRTLILEKYNAPLLSPRAQSLNERSMEFFMRWKIADQLRAKTLLPKDFPMRGVWCSKLNGKTYASAGSQDQFDTPVTAEKAIRIPLYLTEAVLRERLNDFDCVTFLKEDAVDNIHCDKDTVTVTTQKKEHYQAPYLVGCDGANSITRHSADIAFEGLTPKRRVINLLFQSDDLYSKITVEKGFLYYLLENETVVATGPIDINKGIWYAQIVYPGNEASIDDIDVDQLLEKTTGVTFSKTILNKHFWDMQIQLASHFSKNNRVFLLGDAAHAFSPTGGFGLNTGLGDVTNLAWKLAYVIRKVASEKLLSSYESERRPVAIRNLAAAEKNAADAIAVRTQFPPDKQPEAFSKENARIAKQHVHSAGIALGYCYNPNETPLPASEYKPICRAGYFLPHTMIQDEPIYKKLSPTHWTLIICGKEKIKFQIGGLKMLHAPEKTYSERYILIRPDWHIALTTNVLSEVVIKNYFEKAYQQGRL